MIRKTRLITLSVACMLGGAAHAGSLGSSSDNAAYSARQLLLNGVTQSGVFWFDPDGAGGASPFQAYADQTTNGGGWMLVRHVAGTGGWINVSDNLHGTQVLNSASAGNPNASLSWSINYAAYTQGTGSFMFSTGNGRSWGALSFNSVFTINPDFNPNAIVQGSSGLGVGASGMTNVLHRPGFAEDPWIGFEGNHWQNIGRMMYGEAGWGNGGEPHSAFKNANGGINVWIRESVTPPVVSNVPEPETYAMLLAGLGLMGGIARRRKAARA